MIAVISPLKNDPNLVDFLKEPPPDFVDSLDGSLCMVFFVWFQLD